MYKNVLARKGFALLHLESQYPDSVFCIVTVDGWFNRYLNAPTIEAAFNELLKRKKEV